MMKVTRDTIRHLPQQQQQQPLLYNVYEEENTFKTSCCKIKYILFTIPIEEDIFYM